MAPNILHLPNGATVTVTSVFGGLYFKSNDLSTHQQTQMPPGWTIVLHSEDDESIESGNGSGGGASGGVIGVGAASGAGNGGGDIENSYDDEDDGLTTRKQAHIHRYRRPTLHNDALFISSLSIPSSNDFKPAASPTRQIALMLWATLWWYFHQPHPEPQISTAISSRTPQTGKPKGEWRIRIKRQGVFKGRHLLSKLERMGLISSEDSSVGSSSSSSSSSTHSDMFVSQRAFWQLDARIFLFTLSPTTNSPFPSASPFNSRPSSPNRDAGRASPRGPDMGELGGRSGQGLWSPQSPGPFTSTSHLPTFFPPAPLQYVFTNGIRHPLRPRPPRQGETFYTRYVPSVGQYLSFRVASLSRKSVVHSGPVGAAGSSSGGGGAGNSLGGSLGPGASMSSIVAARGGAAAVAASLNDIGRTDLDLLHTWMNDPRVDRAWGVKGPIGVQEDFLRTALESRHSFPVIGCWDGRPFGYFEIYWVKEDILGPHVAGEGGAYADWDRGIHVLVGEQEFRGAHRVRLWLSALVHYCWLADCRTTRVMAEPRVDNTKFIDYLRDVGFHGEKEIAFPHKQSLLVKTLRESWLGPCL